MGTSVEAAPVDESFVEATAETEAALLTGADWLGGAGANSAPWMIASSSASDNAFQ